MDFAPLSLTGPFGLRFAMQGRRRVFWLALPVLSLATGTLPHPIAAVVVAVVVACVTWMGARMTMHSPWGFVLDTIPPGWLLATIVTYQASDPLSILLCSLFGFLLVPFWLASNTLPLVSLDQLEAEARRLALDKAVAGQPINFVSLVRKNATVGPERGIVLSMGDATRSSGARFVRLHLPVETMANGEDTPSTFIRLWEAPTTAHAKLPWLKEVESARAEKA